MKILQEQVATLKSDVEQSLTELRHFPSATHHPQLYHWLQRSHVVPLMVQSNGASAPTLNGPYVKMMKYKIDKRIEYRIIIITINTICELYAIYISSIKD